MGATARSVGLLAAVAMFVFSAYMYQRSGDWVALLFAAGSLGYAGFFFTRGRGQ